MNLHEGDKHAGWHICGQTPNNVGHITYLGTTDACQKSVSRVNQMAGTELMANPNKETGRLPTGKDKALTPL
jgi:hypothetical protein